MSAARAREALSLDVDLTQVLCTQQAAAGPSAKEPARGAAPERRPRSGARPRRRRAAQVGGLERSRGRGAGEVARFRTAQSRARAPMGVSRMLAGRRRAFRARRLRGDGIAYCARGVAVARHRCETSLSACARHDSYDCACPFAAGSARAGARRRGRRRASVAAMYALSPPPRRALNGSAHWYSHPPAPTYPTPSSLPYVWPPAPTKPTPSARRGSPSRARAARRQLVRHAIQQPAQRAAAEARRRARVAAALDAAREVVGVAHAARGLERERHDARELPAPVAPLVALGHVHVLAVAAGDRRLVQLDDTVA